MSKDKNTTNRLHKYGYSSSDNRATDKVMSTKGKPVISASCKALIRQLLQHDPSQRPTIAEIKKSNFMSSSSSLSLSLNSTNDNKTLHKRNKTDQGVTCKSVALTNLV